MKVTTSLVGGRAPPPRKTPPQPAGSRWPAELSDLTPQLGQLGLLRCRQPRTDPAIDLGLLDPGAQGLDAHVQLAGHRLMTPWSPGSSRRSSWTIRTARSLISGGYLRCAGLFPFGVDMTDSFPSETVSTISRADQAARRATCRRMSPGPRRRCGTACQPPARRSF